MDDKLKVEIIPAKPKLRDKKVAIYARVSSSSAEQLKSLQAQVSGLTRFVRVNATWLLVDIYMDIATSKTGSSRKEFNRLVDDCIKGMVDIVITKSISRFGRDTVEVLNAFEKLKQSNTRVIFFEEGIDSSKDDAGLYITVHTAITQAENENRSENIRWGIKRKVEQGNSKLLKRKCYGYVNGKDGTLIIDEKQAKVVRLIFQMYLDGYTPLGIIKELEKLGIKSPSGNDKWAKSYIDKILKNEKYTGSPVLLDNGKYNQAYKFEDNNPAIIEPEIFDAVQMMRAERSNVAIDENGQQIRKSTKYSSKKR